MARTSFVDVALRLRGARRFNAEVAAATKQLEAMGVRGAASMASFSQKAERFKSVGRSLTLGVTLPVVAASAAAIKMSMDYNATFGKIQRLVGISSRQLEAWKDDVLAISDETGVPATELGDALFFVTSAGLRGKLAIDALRISAKAAAAGLGETKTVADAVTSAMNAYGPSVLSAGRATDVMLATVAAGKMEPAELAGTIGRVIPIAQAMGVSFDQAAGAMAVMTKAGAATATASTQVAGVLMTFAKPTTSMVSALEQMGLSLQGVRNQLADKGLVPTLAMLRDRAAEAGIDLSEVFGNRRALTGVLQLTKNVRDTEKVMRAVADSTGATDKAFRQLGQTKGFPLRRALNELQNELIRIGDELGPVVLPQLAALLGTFADIAKVASRAPKWLKILVAGFFGLAAVLGPVVWAVGVLAKGIGGFLIVLPKLIALYKALALRFAILRVYIWSTTLANTGFLVSLRSTAALLAGKFISAIKAATLALWRMAIAALANPYVLLAAALILVVVALVVAYKRVEWFRKAVDKTMEFLRKNWFVTILSLPLAVAIAAVSIIRNWNKIKGGISSAVKFVTSRVSSMIGFFRGLPSKVANAVRGAFDGLKTEFQKAIDAMKTAWDSLRDKLKSFSLPGGGPPIGIPGLPIPGLAAGGTISQPGFTMVGERGPELLSLPKGASVIPLSQSVVNNVGGPSRIEVPVYLNGRQIALAVADEVSNARARA